MTWPRRAAREGITLVKNEGVLPLDRAKVRKIAVIGHLADKPNIGDYGSSRVRPAYVVTPLEGLRKATDAEILYADGKDLEEAKKAAGAADAVVFVVGYNHDDEGEFVSGRPDEQLSGRHRRRPEEEPWACMRRILRCCGKWDR